MATDTLSSFIAEVRKNKFSLIPNLSENDVVSIWETASDFIEKQMLQHKGVAIPGLGVFTFSQKKIDVGSNKFIVIQRPVFVISEWFVQTHSLHYIKQHTSGQIPIVPLNFTVLSNETPFSRDSVEMCIKELLQSVSRSLAARRNIQFDFYKIGRLLIRDNTVKMRFFREFIVSLDSSGEMENAFSRPDTTRSELSIMSNPMTPRPSTSHSLVLPRIVEPSSIDALNLEVVTSRPATSNSVTGTGAAALDKMPKVTEEDDQEMSDNEAIDEVKVENNSPTEHQQVSLPSSSGGSSRSSDSRQLVPKPATLFVGKETGKLSTAVGQPSTEMRTPGSTGSASRRTGRRLTSGEGRSNSRSSSCPGSSVKLQFAVRPSTCSHSSPAGQELCYLCHQRELRNVPIDISEERRERERLHDKMLQDYQNHKDLLFLSKEQNSQITNEYYSKEIASFNLDVSQRKRLHNTKKSSEFHPSYVFQQRALTPAKHLKQMDYCSQLDDQVTLMQTQLKEMKDKKEKKERTEQTELAKELASYQEAYAKDKAAKVDQYQKALAEQVAIKRELSSPGISGPYRRFLHDKLNAAPPTITPASLPPPTPTCTPPNSIAPSRLNSRLRPLSLPKPTVIVPFSHTKCMKVLRTNNNGVTKMVHMKALPFVESPRQSIQHSPSSSEHQPVFGIHKEQNEYDRALFKEQLTMAAEKQRKTRQRASKNQQDEADMLRRTRQELLEDIHATKLEKLEERRLLENSWNSNIKDKHRQLHEELNYSKEPSLLLHQQCEKYTRCKQCQRRRENHGQSNLLCESRYISGSRLMV